MKIITEAPTYFWGGNSNRIFLNQNLWCFYFRAQFNLESYGGCFPTENTFIRILARKTRMSAVTGKSLVNVLYKMNFQIILRRNLVRPRWLTNEQLIRRKCIPTEGELKPKPKNSDVLWKSLWLHASLMLLANKISCIRNSIFLNCWFLFACCTLYNALDLNLDFSKFKLPFKFNKNNNENIYTG